MQPEESLFQPLDAAKRGLLMERVILTVRSLWFGAREMPLPQATALVEHGGELVMLVDASPEQADALVARATGRGAYMVATSVTRPSDLGARLQMAGFRVALRQRAYVWEEAAPDLAGTGEVSLTGLRGLLDRLRRTAAGPLAIRQIGQEELPVWNAVCWRAFGRRGREHECLGEKQQAFRAMGAAGRWFLATLGGRPAGTALLFQDQAAAQILAVGTDPSCRGRGVATGLMRHIMREWQQSGRGFLFLDTEPGSVAEQLYIRLGFREAYLREVWTPGRP